MKAVSWKAAASRLTSHRVYYLRRNGDLAPVKRISKWGCHNVRIECAGDLEVVVDDRTPLYVAAKEEK